MFLFPQNAPNKATLFITIFQNTKQSEEDMLTGQNEAITQTKIWGYLEITFCFQDGCSYQTQTSCRW